MANQSPGVLRTYALVCASLRVVLFIGLLSSAVALLPLSVQAAPDAPPIAIPDERLGRPIGAPVTIDVLANDIDADNDLDPSSVRLINPNDLSSLETTVIIAGEGVWQVNTGNGDITFTPCSGSNQPHSSCRELLRDDPFPMEYSVSDQTGLRSNPAIITITFDANATAPPVIQDDEATTFRGEPVTIDVLDNDSDPDGELDPGSVTIFNPPSHGRADPSQNGAIVYTPDATHVGSDQFVYRVCNTDESRQCGTATVSVSVAPPAENMGPDARDDIPPDIVHNQATVIDVLANDSDPDGELDPASVAVVGSPASGTAAPDQNGSGSILYTPNDGYTGTDQFRYQVCDDGSPAECAEATVFLRVLPPANLPPEANDDQATVRQNRAMTIPILSNDWDLDGTLDPASVEITMDPQHGSVAINPENGVATYTPEQDYTGTDEFRYTVCDQGSPALCSNEATVRITVAQPANQPPVATNDSRTTQQGTPVTINVLNNDSDPDGDLDPTSLAIQSQPVNGTAVVDAGGTITYTPDQTFAGSDTLIYQICDDGAEPLCDSATVTIVVIERQNEAPTAVDDNRVTQQGVPIAIAVLNNDEDPEDALDPASVRVTAAPENGQTNVDSTSGVITYTPDAEFSGIDTFVYEVCDDARACDSATVTIEVTERPNQAPTALDDNFATRQGTPITMDLLQNDTDPEDDLDPASVQVTDPPSAGETSVDSESGAVTYTPQPAFAGTDAFVYEVCDSAEACDSATVTIEVTERPNEPPTALNDSYATRQNQPITMNVLDNDRDPEGELDASSVKVLSEPGHGETRVEPATGAITYLPEPDFVATDTFTYEVCDAAGACDDATVTIRVIAAAENEPPTAVDDSAVTEQEQATTIDVLSNDGDNDGELDPASVQVLSEPANGQTDVVSPTGAIIYTPASEFTGSDQFTYQVCDDDGACSTATVTVTVIAATAENTIFVVDDRVSGLVNQAVTGNVLRNDSDAEGDEFQAPTLGTEPERGEVDLGTDGSFTYRPQQDFVGEDSFTYGLCDDNADQACGTATVTITIRAAANRPPVAVDDEVSTRVNEAVTIDVLANDVDPDGNLLPGTLAIDQPAQSGMAVVENGVIVYTPAQDQSGSDSFNYTICDAGDPQICDDATVRVTIRAATNATPIAVDDAAFTRPNRAVTIDVLANDLDPDGRLLPETLTVTEAAGQGDAVAANGAIVYTPGEDYAGEDRFTYSICDNGDPQACADAAVSVTIRAAANVAPIAVDDAAVMRPGQTLVIDVLANDVDLDGELAASTLAISGTVAPGSATVTNGKIEYAADPAYVGDVTFDYRICDDGAPPACDTATVTITISRVINRPPIAVNDDVATLPDQPVEIRVLVNDVDPDGALDPTSLAIDTPPANGAAEISGETIRYTPATGFAGEDTFVYQVCDNGEPTACATATVRITVIANTEGNEAYAFNDSAYVRAGETVSGNVLSNDFDPENDGWQAPTVETEPMQGSVELLADGTFTYTASLNFTGSDSWTYRVCDLGEPVACAEATVLITVAPPNTAPVAGDDAVVTRIDTPVTGNVLINDSDPDGDLLSIEAAPVAPPASGQVDLQPSGQFTYTPTVGFTGADSFTYQACDPDGLCAAAEVTVDVRAANMANASPYATNDQAVALPNTTVSIAVLANDSDVDGALNPTSLSILTAPQAGTAVAEVDGTVTFTAPASPEGSARFAYRICDNGAPVLCATAEVVVELTAAGSNATYAFEDTAWGRAPVIRGNVLANDMDVEGDGQTVATTPVVAPTYGRVTLEEDGAFTYEPESGALGRSLGGDFDGSDQFTYQVCDDAAPPACATGTAFVRVLPPNLGWDFGDAFAVPTALARDGPRHAIVEGLHMGDLVDAEADGISNTSATMDDITDLDDETIIEAYPVYEGNGVYALDVPVTNLSPNPAQLVGWIDWNVNFSFDDPGERSLPAPATQGAVAAGVTDDTFSTGNVPAGFSGVVTLVWQDFAIPGGQSPTKPIRLRLAGNLPGSATFFSEAGPGVMGPATGGNVIDALAPIATQRVIVSRFTALPGEDGRIDFAWTTELETDVDGFHVLVDQDGELVQVNDALVPSQVTNATVPTEYAYSAAAAGEIFYLQIVMLSSETFLEGPARLGVIPPDTVGKTLLLPIIAAGSNETDEGAEQEHLVR